MEKPMNLDDIDGIRRLDKSSTLNSINGLPQQCKQVIDDFKAIHPPVLNGKVDNIVIPGMGGSAFAPEIVKTLFFKEIKVPYEIVRGYHLPGYVNKRSLIVISSYSATTKEAISCGIEAIKMGCPVLVICSHREENELFLLAKKEKLPGYIFKETYNPGLQPRFGSGYMVYGHVALLLKAGLINLKFAELSEAILRADKLNKFTSGIGIKDNKAKQMAKELSGSFPILVASEFLEGAIHGFANQLNESSKMNSAFHYIPELNHHRMEGLEFPKEFKSTGVFVFYPSDLYSKRVQKRYPITKDVIEKNGFRILEFKPQGGNKIVQTLEIMIFNSYVSFYLAMLNQKDPSNIPWVDYFKEKLGE